MERKNELGLDGDDLAQLDIVQEELMDLLASMNVSEYTEEHLSDLRITLEYGLWIVGGIIYKHDFDLHAACGDSEEEEETEEDDE